MRRARTGPLASRRCARFRATDRDAFAASPSSGPATSRRHGEAHRAIDSTAPPPPVRRLTRFALGRLNLQLDLAALPSHDLDDAAKEQAHGFGWRNNLEPVDHRCISAEDAKRFASLGFI